MDLDLLLASRLPVLHGRLADAQPLGDRLVAVALRSPEQDVALHARQDAVGEELVEVGTNLGDRETQGGGGSDTGRLQRCARGGRIARMANPLKS